MNNKIHPDVDIVRQVLVQLLEVQPGSAFVASLLRQYDERGGLSKKQLQGLYDKASKVESIVPAKLATLEAIILKKPNRYKSSMPEPTPLYEKDEQTGQIINSIIEKYPEHKRVLFLKSKYDNNEILAPAEISELQRLAKILNKS